MDEIRETMTGYERVGDHADHSYLLLTGSVAEDAAELATSGKEYGVLVDPTGQARMLLTAGGSAPAVAVDASAPMERVLAADIVAILNSGVPGLVVTDGSKVVGVLSAAAVIDYLVEHSPVRSGDLGDGELHGDAPVAPLKLTCATRNTVVFFAAGETLCSQGHPLSLTWD
jgi:hypothetical protein